MDPPVFWSRDEVAHHLAISTATLVRFEGRGLIRAVRSGSAEGFGPAEIRKLWTIVTFQRDLGINLAGIEVILRLRDELASIHDRLGQLARDLHRSLDEGGDADAGPGPL